MLILLPDNLPKFLCCAWNFTDPTCPLITTMGGLFRVWRFWD